MSSRAPGRAGAGKPAAPQQDEPSEGEALTPRQQRFVAEYLKDLNAKQAAIRAGYSPGTAESQASRLLRNVKVAAAVAAAQQERARRTKVSTDRVLRELVRFAMADPAKAFDAHGALLPIHKMPPSIRRAVASVEVEELFEGRGDEREQVGVVRKVKFWDKPKGLELLGKHLGLFVEKVELSGSVGVRHEDALDQLDDKAEG